MNIVEILEQQSRSLPDNTAIIEGGQRIGFTELNERCSKAAALLKQSGLQPGDTVLVLLPVSIELYVVLLALFRLGLTAMFIDPQAGRDHMQRCCSVTPPKAFIGSTKAHLLRLLSAAVRRIPVKFAVGWPVPGATSWQRWQQHKPVDKIYAVDKDTAALITFTSGSTGLPKAALRSHGFLLQQHRVLEKSLKLQPGETDLVTLPVFVLANLASGVTSLIPNADLRYPGHIKPAPVIAQVHQHKPQRCAASPAFLERLAEYSVATKQLMTSFRQLYTGGAPVFPPLWLHLQKTVPHAEVTVVYGSTEAEPIAHMDTQSVTEDELKRMYDGFGLLVGKPVEDTELRIIRDQWGTPLGTMDQATFESMSRAAMKGSHRQTINDHVGEIVVSGDHVLSGYLGGRGDDESKFDVEGRRWHRTGDAGYIDHLGRLWLVGRCRAKVSDKHGILYPFMVECAALGWPKIKRAAFANVAGKNVLAIQSHRPLTPEDATNIPAAIQKSLTWAHLDHVIVIDTIPTDKRHNAKVDYTHLDALLKRRLG